MNRVPAVAAILLSLVFYGICAAAVIDVAYYTLRALGVIPANL